MAMLNNQMVVVEFCWLFPAQAAFSVFFDMCNSVSVHFVPADSDSQLAIVAGYTVILMGPWHLKAPLPLSETKSVAPIPIG